MNQTNLSNEKNKSTSGIFEGRFSLFLTGLGAYFAIVLTIASLFAVFIILVEEQSVILNGIFYYLFFSFLYLLVYCILTAKIKNLTLVDKLLHIIKRLLDVIISSLGLFFFLPLLFLVAIAIRIESRGPIFYRSKRVGQYGKLFDVYKFRTILLSPTEQPITRIGKFLRRFSIDELPQIYNVLEGDLSIVGPWARIPKYLEKTIDKDQKILSMKPGITGLWQISFSDIDQAQEYDLNYVENWSLLLDLKIILKTVFVILTNDALRLTPR